MVWRFFITTSLFVAGDMKHGCYRPAEEDLTVLGGSKAQLHVDRAPGCGHFQPGWEGSLCVMPTCFRLRSETCEALAIILTVLLSRLVLKKGQSLQLL